MKLDTDRITNVNANALLRAGETAILAGDANFDLSAVKRCDSSAVALLLAWQRAAQAAGRPFQVQSVPPSLRSLALLYGVESLIPGAG